MTSTLHSCPACGVDGDAVGGTCPRGHPLPPASQGGQWLRLPPDAAWPDGQEGNPFLRWRRLLWAHHRAMNAGWTDDDFVGLVEQLDAAVATVDGSGFRVRPYGSEPALAAAAGLGSLGVKDETGNVGGSHKARHLMGLLLHLAVDAVASDRRLAISSCGNAAVGAATVAQAAGRPIDVFIPVWADPAVVTILDRLDATVHVCLRQAGEAGDPCMRRFEEAVDRGALAFGVQAAANVWTLDGGRTLGFELGDDMAGEPVDNLVVQVGGGALLTSVGLGILGAVELGVLGRAPAIWAAQAEGAAPFDRAWRRLEALPGRADERLCHAGRHADELMEPWLAPVSAATGILDDVTYDWLGVSRALIETGGGSIVVPEPTILSANRLAREHTSIGVDPTGTAGLAGLMAAVTSGEIGADSTSAVLFTGRDRS